MASFESKPASNHEERVNLSGSKNQTCQQEGGVFVPTSAEEDAVIRKLDYHLMPPILLFYTLSVLDRSNLGNARLAGLPESVDLSGNHYDNLATIFYVAYICFQWTALGFKKFPAHIWISCVIFSIGFLSTMQAVAINYPALCALRFFLGIAEACYAGTPYYLSFFYPREKVGFRAGIFISGAALANAYGGVLGYAISHIKGGIPPWKYLFIIEGIPSCLVAGLAFFFLPDNLGSANFLTEREREIANHYIQRGQTAELHTGIHFREWFAAFKNPLTYIPGLMYFSCNVCFASLPLFVPSIILEIGTFNSVQSNGLSAPPYILTFITILLSCWLSDKFKMRGPFAGGAAFVASIGYLLLATTDSAVPRYIGVFLAINIFVSVAILLSWVANSHSTESQRAGGFTILATIGQCGPLLGTNIFPSSQAPYFREGSWVSFVFCMAVVFGSLSYSLLLRRENRRLDRVYATQSQDVVEQGGNDFRYML